jgi:hypothetical protein
MVAGKQRLDMEALQKEIREEAARRRAGLPSMDAFRRFPETFRDGAVDWEQLQAHLDVAARHANIGATVPPVTRFGALLRPLVRLVARLIMSSAHFLTLPQREFNFSILRALQTLGTRLRNLECQLSERRTTVGQEMKAEGMWTIQDGLQALSERLHHLEKELQWRGLRCEMKKEE